MNAIRPTNKTALVTTAPSDSGKVDVTFTPEQSGEVERRLAEINLADMTGTTIVQLGQAEGQALRSVLDDFLSRVDEDHASRLYQLCERINDGVTQANLPSLRDQILADPKPPGFFQRLLGYGKQAAQVAVQSAYNQVVATAAERTATLNEHLDSLEDEVQQQLEGLHTSIREMQDLKDGYRELTGQFTVAVGVAQQLRQQQRDEVARLRQQALEAPGTVSHTDVQEAEAKLELLESRTLTLEATVARLPADWLVIQQIQGAGITTFQEVVTTASDRFNSIKMTLLTLAGLLKVKGVQMVSRKQRELDQHLAEVRGGLMHEVIRTAAEEPGKNRELQAAQIKSIVDDAIAIKQLVDDARQANRDKFSDARRVISSARASLLAIESAAPRTPLLPQEKTK